MYDISIVGGGITGIAAAYLAAKNCITVFEASKNLGGILRDCESNDQPFFSSCQYFNGEAAWFNSMGLKKQLYQFEHTYGSYTDIFGGKTISSEFAGPVFEGRVAIIDLPKRISGCSLDARCDVYPPEIAENLKKWFIYIGLDINLTHHSSVTGFQASRIHITGQNEKLRSLKEQVGSLADSIYGLPRSALDLPIATAFLPRNGFNNVFENLIPASDKIMKIEKSTTVNCEVQDKRIILKTKNGNFDSDFVVWTANPTKLIYQLFGQKLDSQKFHTEILVGVLDSNVPCPFYIQVFSSNSRVLRIYLYNIKNRGCFTIEKGFDDEETVEIVNFCQMVIANFSNLKILEVIKREKNMRFSALTVKDSDLLSKLHTQEIVKNLIVPDYLSYGRDQRIDSIHQQFRDIGIL